MSSLFFQSLEGRMLLSASVKEPSPQLAADIAKYQADIQQYKNDAAQMSSTLAADRSKLALDQQALCNAKKAAKVQLQSDQLAFVTELKANADKGTPIYNEWKVVLDSDKAAIKADGDNKDKRAADVAKYNSDFAAFRADMQPIEDGTKAIIAKWQPVLNADKSAMNTGGSDACAVVKADKLQLTKDEQSFKKLLCTDQKTINTDAAQMKKDGGGDHKDGDKKTEPTKPDNKK